MPIALRTSILCALLSLSLSSSAQQKPSPFVKQNAPMVALEHVRVIDGAGGAAQEDILIDHCRRQNRRRGDGESPTPIIPAGAKSWT